MKILVVEHDEQQRQAIARALEADGHELIYAKGCGDALKKFAKAEPDLVLMDIALADGDGYQCTQRIRALGGERLAPVILSTSIDDHLTLRRFVDCGAADFIDEPSDPLVLRAKISGHAQTRHLYQHLESMREKFHQEVKFAKHMFDAVLGRSPIDIGGLQHWTITAGHFCGDLMIHEVTPDGRLNILLGDFTGHGLAAAVGALPVSDVFFAMTRKGLPLGQIAAEINRKLHLQLPTGHFCAATLVSLDVEQGQLEAWIGGQPPLLLVDQQHQITAQVESSHFPLGIMNDDGFDETTQTLSLTACSHLLLYSDGLLEARNAEGEMFGEARLAQALSVSVIRARKTGLMQSIKTRLISFLDGLEPHDDVSVLAIELPSVVTAS
ncbi:MAG: SpoIIE family protein phosphatase [Rhodocyclaceae bacterium]|nr:SpoIIE family protein phosphatase [Rhodocyclaceae bacterium]MDZ4213259.1 SpoIIE family protein phosphatase [Rhodocyclaceae bacterium]